MWRKSGHFISIVYCVREKFRFYLRRMFQVVSKTSDDGPAFSALFMDGRRQPVDEYPGKTPRHRGTMVTALGLFHNLPVRQKAVAAAVELDALRHGLCALALIHPGVAFQLKNEGSAEIILGCDYSIRCSREIDLSQSLV